MRKINHVKLMVFFKFVEYNKIKTYFLKLSSMNKKMLLKFDYSYSIILCLFELKQKKKSAFYNIFISDDIANYISS